MRQITVACKIPGGIYIGEHLIYGTNWAREQRKRNPQHPFPGGFALTQIPEDIWRNWIKSNKDSSMVQRNLIFADVDQNKLSAKCMTHRRTTSGLEGGTTQGFRAS